jgi:hypothetical protein
MDLDYLATYLLRDGIPPDVRYRYRGKQVDIDLSDSEILHEFVAHLSKSGRCFEFLNLVLLVRSARSAETPLPRLFRTTLERLLGQPNDLLRSDQIEHIFNMLEFYFDSKVLTITDHLELMRVLTELDASALPIKQQFLYRARVSYLTNLMETAQFEWAAINAVDCRALAYAEFVFAADPKRAVRIVETLRDTVARSFGLTSPAVTPFRILGFHQGSVVVEAMGYTAAFLLVARLIREVADTGVRVTIQYQMAKQILKLMRNSATVKDLKDVGQLTLVKTALSATNRTEITKMMREIQELRIYPHACP